MTAVTRGPYCTGRIDAGHAKIEVFGDEALFEHWRENAKF